MDLKGDLNIEKKITMKNREMERAFRKKKTRNKEKKIHEGKSVIHHRWRRWVPVWEKGDDIFVWWRRKPIPNRKWHDFCSTSVRPPSIPDRIIFLLFIPMFNSLPKETLLGANKLVLSKHTVERDALKQILGMNSRATSRSSFCHFPLLIELISWLFPLSDSF